MSYTQLPRERLIQIASEFVGLGDPIPQEIVAHLGPEIILLIENPGAQHGTNGENSNLDSPRSKGSVDPSLETN